MRIFRCYYLFGSLNVFGNQREYDTNMHLSKQNGWSINNRMILNYSHFFRKAIFFQSVFTQGKYTHWQIITAALVRHGIICYSGFVSHCFTLQLGGSANSVLWRGRHFWKIVRVNAHWFFASSAWTERSSLNRHLKTWGSAGAWGSAGQTVSIFAFFHPLSRSASGRSGFASKSFLPVEMSWSFGPWSFGIMFERVRAVLLFKLNLRRNNMR